VADGRAPSTVSGDADGREAPGESVVDAPESPAAESAAGVADAAAAGVDRHPEPWDAAADGSASAAATDDGLDLPPFGAPPGMDGAADADKLPEPWAPVGSAS